MLSAAAPTADDIYFMCITGLYLQHPARRRGAVQVETPFRVVCLYIQVSHAQSVATCTFTAADAIHMPLSQDLCKLAAQMRGSLSVKDR